MRPYFQPLTEYQRIARNKPHSNIDPAYPKTTDGTTASIIQKTPRRIIQQLPTGKVVSDANDWTSIVADFVFTHRILPNANSQHALLQKDWLAVKGCLTNGAAVGYVPFVKHGEYTGTDLLLPNLQDVWLEKGKISDTDSNVICMRGWYQPWDIDAIINKENKLSSKAKERKDKYESGWDLTALASIKDELETKKVTGDQAEKDKAQSGIPIVHVFQRGVKAKFYSVHVASSTIVRTVENKDPRGEIPIHYLYADIDGKNPLGTGYVELVGSLQNLMDSEMQMYQFNRALMLAPPVIKRGMWSKSQAKMIPNSIWDLGSDPNNSVETLKLDTTAISNFPALYGLTKSQLLNMLASPDTSISADVGNPGFSKTPAGVNAQQQTMSVDDNYIRKNFETWHERIAETMINRYFAEREGKEEIQLDDAYAEKLRKIKPEAVSDDNKIRVDWSQETKALKFEVDASTSNMKDDAAERDRLVELLDISQKYPNLDKKNGGPIDCTELIDRIVVKSGVEDPAKIVPKEDPNNPQPNPQGQQQAQMAQEHQQQAQQLQQHIQELQQQLAEEQQVPYKDAPESIKRQKEQRAGYAPATTASPQQLAIDQKTVDLGIKGAQAHIAAVGAAHDHVSKQAQLTAPPDIQDPNAPTDAAQAPEPLPSDNLSPEDHDLIQQLQAAGYPDEAIGKGLAMLHHGVPGDQIAHVLEGSNG